MSSKPGTSLKQSMKPAFAFVILLWLIKSFEVLFNMPLQGFGVYPGELLGTIGIFTGPLIHGSYEHLLSNSLPLLLLVTALFYGYPKSKWKVSIIVWLGGGLGTWLFAREAYHFGASGLTHGLFFFLLLASILRRDKRSVVLMMIAFFMYGGMTLSILPQQPGISFEYHLFGAISGLVSALLFFRKDPVFEEPKYAWENEQERQNTAEYDTDDLIGDEWKLGQDEVDSENTTTNNTSNSIPFPGRKDFH